jgi:hypothetical protein
MCKPIIQNHLIAIFYGHSRNVLASDEQCHVYEWCVSATIDIEMDKTNIESKKDFPLAYESFLHPQLTMNSIDENEALDSSSYPVFLLFDRV